MWLLTSEIFVHWVFFFFCFSIFGSNRASIRSWSFDDVRRWRGRWGWGGWGEDDGFWGHGKDEAVDVDKDGLENVTDEDKEGATSHCSKGSRREADEDKVENDGGIE